MPMRLLEHVSVWIDDLATPTSEAFSHGMHWALNLRLPLRVVITAARSAHRQLGNRERTGLPANAGARHGAAGAPLIERMQAWRAACADAGIVLETSFWQSGSDDGVAHFLRPCGLSVIAECEYDRFRQYFAVQCGHLRPAALLLCPPCRPIVQRLAVLYQHMNPTAAYLETAVHMCQALGARPLIVTVAPTARDGRLKRSHAEGVCASLGVTADFDGIVGSDARRALGRLLKAQQCSHLAVERTDGAVSWPHLHGDWLAPWRGLVEGLGILALPETTALDVPHRIEHRGAVAVR